MVVILWVVIFFFVHVDFVVLGMNMLLDKYFSWLFSCHIYPFFVFITMYGFLISINEVMGYVVLFSKQVLKWNYLLYCFNQVHIFI